MKSSEKSKSQAAVKLSGFGGLMLLLSWTVQSFLATPASNKLSALNNAYSQFNLAASLAVSDLTDSYSTGLSFDQQNDEGGVVSVFHAAKGYDKLRMALLNLQPVFQDLGELPRHFENLDVFDAFTVYLTKDPNLRASYELAINNFEKVNAKNKENNERTLKRVEQNRENLKADEPYFQKQVEQTLKIEVEREKKARNDIKLGEMQLLLKEEAAFKGALLNPLIAKRGELEKSFIAVEYWSGILANFLFALGTFLTIIGPLYSANIVLSQKK